MPSKIHMFLGCYLCTSYMTSDTRDAELCGIRGEETAPIFFSDK